jgi:hypothetical protein
MDTTRTLRIIAGAILSGAIAVAGLGVAAGTGHADPGYNGPGTRWCPGDYIWPGLRATGWDLNVCHVYHEQCPPGVVGGCPDHIVEGPAAPPGPGLICDGPAPFTNCRIATHA